MSTENPPPPPDGTGPGGPPPPPPGSGGTPPPPPAGGAPPPGSYPPPPPGSFGPGPEGAAQPTVSNAFNWGWKKFTENAGVIIVVVLIYLIALIVIQAIWYLFLLGPVVNDDDGVSLGVRLLVTAIGTVLVWVVTTLIQANFSRGALTIARGEKPEIGQMFSGAQLGQLLVAALIIGVAAGIGSLLCYLPALIVLFYTQFTVFFIVDRNLEAVDAIKASAGLVNRHVGTLIGFFLASLLAYILGAIVCLVGLLVALPVVFLAQTFMYLRLQDREITPA